MGFPQLCCCCSSTGTPRLCGRGMIYGEQRKRWDVLSNKLCTQPCPLVYQLQLLSCYSERKSCCECRNLMVLTTYVFMVWLFKSHGCGKECCTWDLDGTLDPSPPDCVVLNGYFPLPWPVVSLNVQWRSARVCLLTRWKLTEWSHVYLFMARQSW